MTTRHPQRATAINEPEPPTTSQNHLQRANHSQPLTTSHNPLQRATIIQRNTTIQKKAQQAKRYKYPQPKLVTPQ